MARTRRILLVPNPQTAPLPLVLQALSEHLKEELGGSPEGCVIHYWGDAEGSFYEALRAEGWAVCPWAPWKQEAPLACDGGSLAGYQRMARLESRDDLLDRLPFAGADRPGATGALWQDRLVWCMAPYEPERLVDSLAWEDTDRLIVIGGAEPSSSLPEAMVARARRSKVSVYGHILGPVDGRHAPLWRHGLVEARVEDKALAQALRAEGFSGPITSARRQVALTPASTGSLDGKTLVLDAGHDGERSLLYSDLRAFVRDHAVGLQAVAYIGAAPTVELLRRHLGESICGCPFVTIEGATDIASLGAQHPILSADPWRAVWWAPVAGLREVSILGDPAKRARVTLPSWAGELQSEAAEAAP